MNNDELLEFVEVSTQSLYVVRDGFFVKTDEKWEKVRYDEILWVRAFENGSVMFLTNERSLMVNHRLWRIEEMLTEHPNFVRINRSEIVNLNAIDGFEGNCYYIGKNPLYATGVYRQRMEGGEPSHEDSRTAWSCLLWSRDVRVTPTSRCDFALIA